MKKLTMVSVGFRGRRLVKFVMADWDSVSEKATVPSTLYQDMAESLGARRGDTFTVS